MVPDDQAVYKDSVFRLLEKFTEGCGGNGQVVQPGEGGGAARCGCVQGPPHHFKLGDFAEKARDSSRTWYLYKSRDILSVDSDTEPSFLFTGFD